ncbi:hypothetical protein C8R43DRAFT_1232393 [Mycena crocata]|nr:hypothetical protein C8R43DRAFT_1232393 [Mycena crocata]
MAYSFDAEAWSVPPSGLGPPASLSCIVYLQHGQRGISEMYRRVVFPSAIMAQRGDSLSVTVPGLLLALRYCMQQQSISIKDATIQELIAGDSGITPFVTLSTMRVPDFSKEPGKADSELIHRDLISLSMAEDLITNNETVAGPVFSEELDILATAESSNLQATTYMRNWAPAQVVPGALFILIFTVPLLDLFLTNALDSILDAAPSSSQETRLGSPDRSNSDASSWSFASLDSSSYDAPTSATSSIPETGLGSSNFSLFDTSTSTGTPLDFASYNPSSSAAPDDSHPLSLLTLTIPHYNIPSLESSPPRGPHLLFSNTPSEQPLVITLPTGKKRARSSSEANAYSFVREISERLGECETFTEAQYKPDSTLTQMVRQHRAMAHLFEVFKLTNRDPAVARKVISDETGTPTMLAPHTAYKGCGWKLQTHKNKGTLYAAVGKAIKLRWKDPVPSFCWPISQAL